MSEHLNVRRDLLADHVFPKLEDPVRRSPELNASLADVINAVRSQGLEGVVAKRLDSAYEPGQRSGAWRKMRINQGQEFVIGGYTLGAKHFGAPYEVYGVAVSGGESFKRERALRIGNEAATIAGIATRLTPDDLVTDQNFIGPGYGIATPECVAAIKLLAETEGILLDPVYTAKAMAALIDHARAGALDPAASVVFVHTGGVPALFAHAKLF